MPKWSWTIWRMIVFKSLNFYAISFTVKRRSTNTRSSTRTMLSSVTISAVLFMRLYLASIWSLRWSYIELVFNTLRRRTFLSKEFDYCPKLNCRDCWQHDKQVSIFSQEMYLCKRYWNWANKNTHPFAQDSIWRSLNLETSALSLSQRGRRFKNL